MLYLIKSNRMEHLVAALCRTLAQVPDDPMAAEWIGIQSRGMKQWLTTAIAREFGICANIRFLFPRQMLEILGDNMGETARCAPMSREMLVWAVMDRLTPDHPWPKALTGPGSPLAYAAEGNQGKKVWQLSQAIARVLDDYQIYRPELLEKWAKPDAWQKEDSATGAAWQAWLWQGLTQAFPGAVSGLPGRFRNLDRRPKGMALPERICLFGISTLPPGFLDAFSVLARHLDVHIFSLSPSDQFFFDLGPEYQLKKLALAQELPQGGEDTGSPLLRTLGKSGREFHGILEQFDYDEPQGELFEDPGQGSILATLQSDILNLVLRREGGPFPPLAADPEDDSVTLHACHSPMREAQVLKDRILDMLDRDTRLDLHDIIVMMPDIEAYAPYLEAVFSQAPRLPFTVSDRRRRSESRTIEAFLKILDLREGRLEKSSVTDLLRTPAIAAKFGIGPQDLVLITRALDRARVFWGRDRHHREKVAGLAFEENTWRFGLSRLLFGVAAPDGAGGLLGPVLPCDAFEGLETEVLGRFTHFCASLFRNLESLDATRSPAAWGTTLRRLILSMMAQEQGQADLAFLLTALDDLCRDATEAGFHRAIPFSQMGAALTDRLDQQFSQGSFMAGSITLCNLMPMRSIPFKVVCLMGMDEKSFPRQPVSPGFDLKARFPRLGDKQVRDEDCYLFLESLLSARERLLITYTGLSISDNSPIPCAGPVAVLKDTMADSFIFGKGCRWMFTHPLHPFSPRYFDGKFPGFFSYSAAQCDIARAQAGRPAGAAQRHWDVPPGIAPPGSPENGPANADPDTLIRFFRRPAESFVRQILGLTFPRTEEAAPDREPFRVTGLDLFALGSLSLDAGGENSLLDRVRAGGYLPLGTQGDLEWQRIESLAAPLRKLWQETCPPGGPTEMEICLHTGPGLLIQGRVPDVYADGRYVRTFGRLHALRLLTQWIYHLCCCAASERPGPTVLVGQDPDSRLLAKAERFLPMDRTAAQRILDDLAGLYVRGQAQVLPFACTPCFYLVRELADNGFDSGDLEKAAAKARPFWTGTDHVQGELADRYTALVMGQADPFANASAVRTSGFLDTGLAVFRPLLEGMAP